MKIVILRSSPHLHGASNTLVDEFKKGAIEADHEIVDIDLARSNLHPCLAKEIVENIILNFDEEDDEESSVKSPYQSDYM